MKSGLPSAAEQIRSRRSPSVALLAACLDASQLLEQAIALGVVERLEQGGRRVPFAAAPARPPLQQLRPRHAEQEDRRVARQVADLLHQVEERLLSPVQIVEHTYHGCFCASCSSSLRNAQAIVSAFVSDSPLRSSERIALAAASSAGIASS